MQTKSSDKGWQTLDILSIVGFIVSLFISLILKDYWKEAIITSFMFSMILQIIELKNKILDNKKALRKEFLLLQANSKKHIDSISSDVIYRNHNDNKKALNLLRINLDFYEEEKLFKLLDKIISILNESDDYKYYKNYLYSILDKKISEFREIIRDGDIDYTIDNEDERAHHLQDIITVAEKSIKAVTYDENNYLDNFWQGYFKEKYISSNIEIANKKVKVTRIFVVNEKIIKGDDNLLDENDRNKRNNLIEICKQLNNVNDCCEAFWVSKEQIQRRFPDNTNTSFLICDDFVVSESYGIVNGKSKDGYIKVADNEENIRNYLKPLNNRFNKYLKCIEHKDCHDLS